MVAAGQDDPGAGRPDPGQRVRKHRHDVHPRQGTVIHIPGNEHDIHALFPDRIHQLVEEVLLRSKHADAVERPAKVPVRCVQKLHGFKATCRL